MFLYPKHNVPNLEKMFSSMPHHENAKKKKASILILSYFKNVLLLCLKKKRNCQDFNSPPGLTLHWPQSLKSCGGGRKVCVCVVGGGLDKKPVHYQKFLTKQFLQKDLGARIVKLKGTVSLKSSCTGPAFFCNLGNSFQKELGHSNGRRTRAV